MKAKDNLSTAILGIGIVSTVVLTIWVFALSWTPSFCSNVECLNNFVFDVLKAPLGVATATIAGYSARILYLRFLQTEKQIALTSDNNTANNFFMHKKALADLCSHLESVHDIEIDAEVVYALLFPNNTPHNVLFVSEKDKNTLLHPFIASRDQLETNNISYKLVARLIVDSFMFQSRLGIKPKQSNDNPKLEVVKELAIYGFNNGKICTANTDSSSIINESVKFSLLGESWGASENKINIVAKAYAKFAGIDLSEDRLSDRLAGFSFLDASLPNMIGIKLIPAENDKSSYSTHNKPIHATTSGGA